VAKFPVGKKNEKEVPLLLDFLHKIEIGNQRKDFLTTNIMLEKLLIFYLKIYFLIGLRFELRALCLPGRSSPAWRTASGIHVLLYIVTMICIC
jgi:hypothetical protein